MLLRCNLCMASLHNNASKKTDVLWLRTINGRDFLVCQFHRENYGNDNSETIISPLSPTLPRLDEPLLSGANGQPI